VRDGILHDIRNFARSVREEYLEYRNSKLEDLPHAQAPRKRPKGRRLGSYPPAAPAAASGIQVKHGRLETGATEERVIVSFGGCREVRKGLVRCARI